MEEGAEGLAPVAWLREKSLSPPRRAASPEAGGGEGSVSTAPELAPGSSPPLTTGLPAERPTPMSRRVLEHADSVPEEEVGRSPEARAGSAVGTEGDEREQELEGSQAASDLRRRQQSGDEQNSGAMSGNGIGNTVGEDSGGADRCGAESSLGVAAGGSEHDGVASEELGASDGRHSGDHGGLSEDEESGGQEPGSWLGERVAQLSEGLFVSKAPMEWAQAKIQLRKAVSDAKFKKQGWWKGCRLDNMKGALEAMELLDCSSSKTLGLAEAWECLRSVGGQKGVTSGSKIEGTVGRCCCPMALSLPL
ncbi:hypothetical protein KFL_015970020 [Klebsormidium nitens]|uniref:Uncharacterized protein n=1 Tax=Klebsormidium nitens TaxID=105231 RepID=A0A1Y1IVT1_KLENI|nr:hypothetical protein KFL_015970020 [Klebsormidium nitens]|eukprot:GAQ93511.1 hypothetical protein KFL_015970020 [Klebsormidium nitens]